MGGKLNNGMRYYVQYYMIICNNESIYCIVDGCLIRIQMQNLFIKNSLLLLSLNDFIIFEGM